MTKLQKRMTIDEFFTIYRAGFRRDDTVEFTVRKKPSIIHLAWRYSNNREWKEQTFRVSGQWKKPEQLLLPENQRVPREWGRMRVGASEAPDLNDEQVDNVDTILAFVKATSAEDAKVVLDFNHLVTNENMRNMLGYEIPIFDLPFLKERKGKTQKPRKDPAPTILKGKEKVFDGSKNSKEPKEVPKTVKKLIADAQRIGAEQEAKAKKAAEKMKTAEKKKKAAESKVVKKPAEKSKAFQERPQLDEEAEREPVRKRPRIEAARSYLKSIGSAVKGISIRVEPSAIVASDGIHRSTEKEGAPQCRSLGEVLELRDEAIPNSDPVVALIASECPPRNTEEEVEPQHSTIGEVPAFHNEDVVSTEPVSQDVILPPVVREEVFQTVLSETDSALPELLNARVETKTEPCQISQPRMGFEVGEDRGSVQIEAENTATGPSVGPIVQSLAERAGPSSSTPFVEPQLGEDGSAREPTRDSVGFFRPA